MRIGLALCSASLCLIQLVSGEDVIPRKKLQLEDVTRGWYDIAPRKYDDLMPIYRVVPDVKNAAQLLLEATDAMQGQWEMGERWRKFSKEGQWDTEYWSDVLRKNTKALELVEKASHKPYLQVDKPVQFEVTMEPLMELMKCIKLLNYHATHALQSGDISGAIGHLETASRLAWMSMEADGGLVGWLVGLACYQQTFEMIQRAVDHPKCSSLTLKKVNVILDRVPNVQPRFMEALRFEFLLVSNTFRDMHNGKIRADMIMGMKAEDGVFRRFFYVTVVKIFLQPNRSMLKHAQIIRYGHELSKMPSWKRGKIKKPIALNWIEQGLNKRDYLSFNAVGNVLLKMAAPLVIKQVEKIEQHTVKLRMLRIKMALRGYHIEKGILPKELNELELPAGKSWLTDPYDGKQLRYSREKLRIWSCGEDRKDAGGLAMKKSAWKRPEVINEPTCLLEFAR